MILRHGLFEGVIKPGQEAAFYAYLQTTLLPVWRSFPGVVSVEVFRGQADSGAAIPLMTLFKYPDLATMEAAIASPQRAEAVRLLPELMAMFDGALTHIVSEPI